MDIRKRLDYFLAKIAGIEVDLGKIKPPKACNTTEELLEEIANRIDAHEEQLAEIVDDFSASGGVLVRTDNKLGDGIFLCAFDDNGMITMATEGDFFVVDKFVQIDDQWYGNVKRDGAITLWYRQNEDISIKTPKLGWCRLEVGGANIVKTSDTCREYFVTKIDSYGNEGYVTFLCN